MSARSTFSHAPSNKKGVFTPKEIADAECVIYEELHKTIQLIEFVSKTNAKEKFSRILRNTSRLRKSLSIAQVQRALAQVIPNTSPSHSHLTESLRLLATVHSSRDQDDVDMDLEPSQVDTNVQTLPQSNCVEIEIYFLLLVIAGLIKYKVSEKALEVIDFALKRCQSMNRRTVDPFQAKLYAYKANIEQHMMANWNSSQISERILTNRVQLLSAYRSACLCSDEFGQATLINLVLQSYLTENLYEQAYKFVTKTSFPENVSNNQYARYLYYVGKIQAVQLEYTESYTKLMQSIRKAPQNTAHGFRQCVQKLAIIVQLLMGEVPERETFPPKLEALTPYMKLTNAVRVGNLEDFKLVLSQYASVFRSDRTYTLILRLHHNVIKTGLRKISTSYSRIYFDDIAKKLALESAQDAEFVCAKAIHDGVIDAVIDHSNGTLQSKEMVNVYTTLDPQSAFQKRIAFCFDVHNDAVKSMRYPPDAYRKDLESAEERLEREKQEEELAKEIEEEMDEEGL